MFVTAAVVVYCVNMNSASEWKLSGVARIANLLHSTRNTKGKILVVGTHSDEKHADFDFILEGNEVTKKCRFLAVSLVTGEGLSEVVSAILQEAFTGTPGMEHSDVRKKEKLEAEAAEAKKREAAQKKKERLAEKEEEFKLMVPLAKKIRTEGAGAGAGVGVGVEEEEEVGDIAPVA